MIINLYNKFYDSSMPSVFYIKNFQISFIHEKKKKVNRSYNF